MPPSGRGSGREGSGRCRGRTIIAGLDRDAIARRRLQAQALEALEFERGREHALTEQLELLVLESEGPRIDAEAFARLEPDDVDLVREALGEGAWGWDDGEVEALLEKGFDHPEPDDDPVTADDGDEFARLTAEIERSRRMQSALERYAAALGEAPS